MSDVRAFPASDRTTLIAGLLRLTDILLVMLVAYVLFWFQNDTLRAPHYYHQIIVLAALLTANFTHVAGIYRPVALASTSLQVVRLAAAWSMVALAVLAFVFVTEIAEWLNPTWAMRWFFGVLACFTVTRVLIWERRRRMRRHGDLTIRIALVGARDLGRKVLEQLRQDPYVQVVGVFDTLDPGETTIEGVPYRGSVKDLVRLVRKERVDEIVIAMIDRSEEEVASVLAKLRDVPINTKFCAHTLRFNLPVRGYSTVGGLPLLHVFQRPLGAWGQLLKGVEDRVLGLILLILALPVMAVIAVLVKLDSPGPVLFRQKRYGFNNNDITVFKFRSMRNDPNPDPSVPQAQRNDPRVTRIGAFLRKSSLDELPQLFNVLQGTMSLVGPRPHAVAHNEHYAAVIDGYLGRHRVKPGITGWAQVNGYRGETDTPEKMRMRVQYDLYYIDNWSLSLDLKILLMTIFVGFVNRNAY
ncbi:undecaprenyl-phosphate glucose phosphotransferase [Elstera sp.]|jgi:putative colanic acid biosynthesis UDP-glucose lipid carrier transferase|uniref:undecaprenyl-phosphate glucose phosphotransferase n=1 Tax=Elstera sp. TaxID=1916664 RepID=UPI0037BFF270